MSWLTDAKKCIDVVNTEADYAASFKEIEKEIIENLEKLEKNEENLEFLKSIYNITRR